LEGRKIVFKVLIRSEREYRMIIDILFRKGEEACVDNFKET